MKTYRQVLGGVVAAFALSALVYQAGLNERGGIGGLLCRYVVCEDEAVLGAAHRRLWSGELDGAVELGQSSLPGRGRQQNTALDGPGTGAVAAIGFDAGRDAGVAGQRPAPRSALEPECSRAAKKWDFSSTGSRPGSGLPESPRIRELDLMSERGDDGLEKG